MRRGLSQADYGKLLGLRQPQISKLEKGQYTDRITDEVAEKLRHHFKVRDLTAHGVQALALHPATPGSLPMLDDLTPRDREAVRALYHKLVALAHHKDAADTIVHLTAVVDALLERRAD